MKILGLDTAMAACSVAVIDSARGQPLAAAFVAMERGHAEVLAPMVADVMREAALEFSGLERIVVTTGPGTFTGLRIGLSFARGLGLALGIPVTGVDSLTAIAANCGAGEFPLLVAADAGNGQAYVAAFGESGKAITAPRIMPLAEAAAEFPRNASIIGTAADAVRDAAGRSDLQRLPAGNLPVAANFARLGAEAGPHRSPMPLYLRPPDAKPMASARVETVSFEPATAAAAPVLAALHAEAFDEGWTAKAFAELLAMPGAEAWLALVSGAPAALLLTRRAADEAEIITLATRPGARRRGLARQLLSRQTAMLINQGVRTIFLEVAESNAAARALYAGLGFVQAGQRKGYYKHNGGNENALILHRKTLV
jgi:tRNA threonylcarbamoyladenosine biosynthesis protein TsaB